MRRNLFPWFMLVVAVALGFWGWRFYAPGELSRWNGVSQIVNAPSSIDLRLTIHYLKEPIYEEVYHVSDINGISHYSYRIRTYGGTLVTVLQPPHETYDVASFFETLEQHGLWRLMNKAPRKKDDPIYTLHVAQSVSGKSGSRTIVFSDPHFWATTAAREYDIHLNPKQPVPDLLQIRGTSLLDPRYEAIVKEFSTFGPPLFRRDVRLARSRALHA